MKVLFSVGPLNIHFFGLMIAIGVIVAMTIIMYEAKQKGMDQDKVSNIVIWGILGIFVGARIGYVLFYDLPYYLENPIRILMFANGGLSVHGGIVGGLVTMGIITAKSKRYTFRELADLFAPPIILAQAISRVGCDVYGKVMETSRFWMLEVGSRGVHPVQMYEFLLNYGFFALLWILRKDRRLKGKIFGIYLMGFAVIRSTVELFRNNPEVFAGISVSHLLSLLIFIVGLIYLITAKNDKAMVDIKQGDRERGNHDYTFKSIVGTLIAVLALMGASVVVFYYVQLNF